LVQTFNVVVEPPGIGIACGSVNSCSPSRTPGATGSAAAVGGTNVPGMAPSTV
jgi:hypothetical protein